MCMFYVVLLHIHRLSFNSTSASCFINARWIASLLVALLLLGFLDLSLELGINTLLSNYVATPSLQPCIFDYINTFKSIWITHWMPIHKCWVDVLCFLFFYFVFCFSFTGIISLSQPCKACFAAGSSQICVLECMCVLLLYVNLLDRHALKATKLWVKKMKIKCWKWFALQLCLTLMSGSSCWVS